MGCQLERLTGTRQMPMIVKRYVNNQYSQVRHYLARVTVERRQIHNTTQNYGCVLQLLSCILITQYNESNTGMTVL